MSQNQQTIVIDWSHPDPASMLDRFAGPGTTRGEWLVQLIPPVVITATWLTLAAANGWGWSVLQFVVAAILMLDMIGGVITNATSSAKRWYHRAGQGRRQHLGFVALHVVQPVVVTLVFAPQNWLFPAVGFGYLVVAAVIVLHSPLYLRRPVAGALLAGGIMLSLYLVPVPERFEWFLPLYYTKLLVSHLLREEPYRPAGAKNA